MVSEEFGHNNDGRQYEKRQGHAPVKAPHLGFEP